MGFHYVHTGALQGESIMDTDREVVSIIVKSSNPLGKGQLIGELHTALHARFPKVTFQTPQTVEDTVPFDETRVHVQLIEAVDVPGSGVLGDQTYAHADKLVKQKREVSALLGLFMNQLLRNHVERPSVEYPLEKGGYARLSFQSSDTSDTLDFSTFEILCDGVEGHQIVWECADLDQAMDIFRHYIHTPLAPPSTWVWVKTMDVMRSTPNYLRYHTDQVDLTFTMHPSGMDKDDKYYQVQVHRAHSREISTPAITGSFSHAVDYFLKQAAPLA